MGRVLVLAIAVLCGLDTEPGQLNDRVLRFAHARVGKQVGDGQCSTLAVEALRDAGARWPRGQDEWGERLATANLAKPGDILQFRDAEFRGRKLARGVVSTWSYSFPHHTAIVAEVRKKGTAVFVTILHQNAGINEPDEAKRLRVSSWTINLAELRSGTVQAYRPIPAADTEAGR